MNRPTAQAGFTLIEGLVAILIFSIGVLALIGLQVASIRQSSAAKYRSDASLLSNQLIGEMWVTDRLPTQLQANFATGGPRYGAWLADVQRTLPIAAASAPTVEVSATGIVTVNVFWKAPNEAPADPAHRYTAIAQVR